MPIDLRDMTDMIETQMVDTQMVDTQMDTSRDTNRHNW